MGKSLSLDEFKQLNGGESKNLDIEKNSKKQNCFTYPYNFVSLGNIEKAERKLGNNSGKIKCTLLNITPIFIGGEKTISNKHSTELFLKNKKNYIIPASSLKGEIRNIIEAITHSCIKSKSEIPKEFEPCNNSQKLCFACRLFGTIIENASNDSNKLAYSGRIYFSDAKLPISGNPTKKIVLKPLGSPNESLKKYYLDKNNKMRGRKFYWHHEDKINKNYSEYKKSIEDVREKPTNSTINILEPLKKFSFEINFKSLTDVELGVLIYALELEKGLLHKIGRGKALGLGSCKITIDSFELFSDKNKYNFLSFNSGILMGNKTLYLNKIENLYLKNNNQLEQLRVILKDKNCLDFKDGAYVKRNFNKGNMPNILDYNKKK